MDSIRANAVANSQNLQIAQEQLPSLMTIRNYQNWSITAEKINHCYQLAIKTPEEENVTNFTIAKYGHPPRQMETNEILQNIQRIHGSDSEYIQKYGFVVNKHIIEGSEDTFIYTIFFGDGDEEQKESDRRDSVLIGVGITLLGVLMLQRGNSRLGGGIMGCGLSLFSHSVTHSPDPTYSRNEAVKQGILGGVGSLFSDWAGSNNSQNRFLSVVSKIATNVTLTVAQKLYMEGRTPSNKEIAVSLVSETAGYCAQSAVLGCMSGLAVTNAVQAGVKGALAGASRGTAATTASNYLNGKPLNEGLETSVCTSAFSSAVYASVQFNEASKENDSNRIENAENPQNKEGDSKPTEKAEEPKKNENTCSALSNNAEKFNNDFRNIIEAIKDTSEGKKVIGRWNDGFRSKDTTQTTLDQVLEQLAMGHTVTLTKNGRHSHKYTNTSQKEAYWINFGNRQSANKALNKTEQAKKSNQAATPNHAVKTPTREELLSNPQYGKTLENRLFWLEKELEQIFAKVDGECGEQITSLFQRGYSLTDQRLNTRRACVEQIIQGHTLTFHHKDKSDVVLPGRKYERASWYKNVNEGITQCKQDLQDWKRIHETKLPNYKNLSPYEQLLAGKQDHLNSDFATLRSQLKSELWETVNEYQRKGFKLDDQALNGNLALIFERLEKGDCLYFIDSKGNARPVQASESLRTKFRQAGQNQVLIEQFERFDSRQKANCISELEKQVNYQHRVFESKLKEVVDLASYLQRTGYELSDKNLNGNLEAIKTQLANGETLCFRNGADKKLVSVANFSSMKEKLAEADKQLAFAKSLIA